MARRRDSACHAHVLGATEREEIRVCRESCVYGRELAMSAEVPATVLPEFVPLAVKYEQQVFVDASPALEALGKIKQLIKSAKAKARNVLQVESGGHARPVEAAPAAAKVVEEVSEVMDRNILAEVLSGYPDHYGRTRLHILRRRYNQVAQKDRRFRSYNEFRRDLSLLGFEVVINKDKLRDSWVVLGEAALAVIQKHMKRAA